MLFMKKVEDAMWRALEWSFVMGALSWVFVRLWIRDGWRLRGPDATPTFRQRRQAGALATPADQHRGEASMAKLVPSLAGLRFAQRASIGFGLITLITAVTAIGTALFARDEAANREKILEVYADDLAEAFQAQLAAEKMVAIGRGYLLVAEPEFLDRLNDAEEQLDRALQVFGTARIVAERDRVACRRAPVCRRLPGDLRPDSDCWVGGRTRTASV